MTFLCIFVVMILIKISLYCCRDDINKLSSKLPNGFDVSSKWFHDNTVLIGSSIYFHIEGKKTMKYGY